MKFLKSPPNLASLLLMFFSAMLLGTQMFFMNFTKTLLIEFSFYEMNSSIISFPIILDWASLTFSLTVCFISSCVMMFTNSYMSKDIFISRFVWVVMLFVLSMNFLIFVPSLVSLLLGWDGLGLVSFCLVIYYQNQKSLGAGLMTAFMNRIGDVAILLGIAWTLSQGHWSTMFMTSFSLSNLVIIMILLAGMTKSAQIPFCSWLPAAMAAPTPVSALVHSSTLVTAGVFLLIRFYPFLSKMESFNTILNMISAMTMLMAGIAANFEMDLKKIIALSTLSQLGVMMFSISLSLPLLALFHLFTHALFKALLFLCAGSIIHAHSNNQDIRKMSHLWSHLPITSTCFNIANLALCGFPFMAGFYSKDLIIETMLYTQNNYILIVIMMTATSLTVSYSIRLSLMIFWSEMKQKPSISASDEDNSTVMPILLLSLGALTSGATLMWIILSPTTLILLTSQDKLLTPTLITLTALIIFFSFKTNHTKVLSMVNLFFTNMWFMTNLSNNLVSSPLMKSSSKALKTLDLGWIELMTGEGLFLTLKTLTMTNQYIQMNKFNLFISLMTISISLTMLLLIS